MRKLIAALAISALPAVAAVLMSLVSPAQAHAACATGTTDNGVTFTRSCNQNAAVANAAKDQIRDEGGKASGSPSAIPGPKH